MSDSARTPHADAAVFAPGLCMDIYRDGDDELRGLRDDKMKAILILRQCLI